MEKEFLHKFYSLDIAETLKECHHSKKGKLNPYHLEDNCLTHTLMVFHEANKIQTDREEEKKILLFSALFHDVGKPFVKEEKNGKTFFTGHEFLSGLIALDYADEFGLTKEEKEKAVLSILYHTIAHSDNESVRYFPFYSLLKKLELADSRGRITEIESKELPLLDPLEKNFIHNPEKELIILFGLVGSGKSTYINNHLSEYFVLSRDNLVDEFAEKENISYTEAYSLIHSDKRLKEKINNDFQRKIKKAKNYNKVVVDMTMLTKKQRRVMINNFPKHIPNIKIFLTSYNELIKRNENRPGKDLSYLIPELPKITTMPTYEEGFNQIEFIFN